jgi:ninein
MVPREQFLQLQHQLLQAERRNQHLQEELNSRTSETNPPQVQSVLFLSWQTLKT